MATYVKWPESLETCRIADHVCATAYETASAEQRACLKNAIAFHARHGQCSTRIESFVEDASKGYWQRSVCTPVPWTLIFCSATYASSARFVAALMPALLAQVPLVGVVSVGGTPSTALLLAMELMGVEDNFVLPHAQSDKIHSLCHHMTHFGQGRILLLHEGSLATLRPTIRTLCIPFWEEYTPPHIRIGHLADNILLSWAQADALYVQETEQKRTQDVKQYDTENTFFPTSYMPSAAFGLDALESSTAQYIWECGMEGCWQHTTLTTHFFQHCQKTAGIMTCEEYCHDD